MTREITMKRINTAVAIAALALTIASAPAVGASKRISAQDFSDPWPFTVSSGRLACTMGSAVTFTANGTQYAVNGVASGRGYPDIEPIWKFNWKMYEEIAKALNITVEAAKAQVGPVRINIGPIINAGLKLC